MEEILLCGFTKERFEKLVLEHPNIGLQVIRNLTAGFLFRPDKTLEIACYSSGPIGRFVAGDVLKLVQFYESRK
jgi:hypothetical protein